MSIPRISFFTLLVILAITEIYSSPVGGKGSKSPESPGGKKAADENVRDINERRVSEDINENSALNPQTVNKHVDAVAGEDGYIPPNLAGPSESNPSNRHREDLPIRSTNPLSDALSSTHLKNKPETTKLSEKKTREMFWDPLEIDPVRQATPAEAISREIEIPDIISLKSKLEDSFFTDMIVPQHVKTNLKTYKAWFMEMVPEKCYYRVKMGSNEVSELKSTEQTKTIIKLQDPTTYGFPIPSQLILIDPNRKVRSKKVSNEAKESLDNFKKWLQEEMPKYFHKLEEIYMIYNPSLSIKYRESLKNTPFV